MANTTIKITQLPSIGNGLSASTILPVVDTTGTAITAKVAVSNVANFILTEAGNTLEPAFLSTIAYSVANAAQPNITSVGTLSVNTLKISGGTNGYVLQTDGTGNVAWSAPGGSGNGEVGGANGQLQFNNAGNFGGDPELTWDASNNQLNTVNFAASSATIYGNINVVNMNATGNIVPNSIYTDNYFYANGDPFSGGNISPGGSNTQIQFNDAGAFAGNTGFTFNKTTGVFSSPFLAGDGNGLSNIQGANVSGTVGNANLSQYINVSDVNNNFSYHVVLSAGSGDKSVHIDADDNLQYNPAEGILTSTRVDTDYLSVDTSVISSLIPFDSLPLTLGNATNPWQDLYLSNSTIYLGDATISANGNSIVVDSITVTGSNVGTIGNVASLNLDGSNSNVLYGNGVFAPASGGNANTGNVTFDNINIIGTGNLNLQPDPANVSSYLDIFISSGPDLHLVASSAANLILGKDDGPNVMTSWDGNVYVQSWNTGSNTQGGVWNFGEDGNLSLPSGGSLYSEGFTPSGAPGNTITLNPHGSGSITNQKFMIYPTAGDGDHIHMTSGNLYQTELFLGSDNFFVKLSNTGNVVVHTDDTLGNTGTWTFGSDGLLTLPSNAVQIGSQYGSEAILASNVAFGIVSQGTAGMTALQWTDDVSNTSQFSAVYINESSANVGDIQIRTGAVGNANIWKFGNDGNLTLPSNTFAVNYANGTQVSLGGGGGNTGNVTFNDQVVQGTGDEYGGSGLYLAPGSNSTANLQYLRVRGGDYPTHIHLDTGNNQYYDQYFGADSRYVKLEANGNVVINADDYAANSGTWTFTSDGNLILADGNSVIQSIANSSLDPLNPNVSTMTLTPDANYNSQVLVLDPTAPGHIHLRAYAFSNIDEPAANIFLGGEATSFEITQGANNQAVIHSNGKSWTFGNDGNITSDTLTFTTTYANYRTTEYQTAGVWDVYVEDSTSGPFDAYAWIDVTFKDNQINRPQVFIENQAANTGVPYRWTFDENGTLTIPGNLVANGYASPAPALSGFSSLQAFDHINIGSANIAGNSTNIIISGDINSRPNNTIAIKAMNDGADNPAQLVSYTVGTGGTTAISAYANNALIQANINGDIKSWNFDNTGNLTLPGNTFAVNYANGTQVSLGGGSYGNSNVANFLASFGSNTISTTGNVRVGQLSVTSTDSYNSIQFSDNGTNDNGYIKVDAGNNMVINSVSNFYVKRAGSDRIAVTDTTSDFMASTNVRIQTNKGGFPAFTWNFDNAGNLTLPGNTFAVKYANGTQVPLIGGSNTQIIFNDAGNSNGSANLVFNKTTNNLTVTGNIITTGIANTGIVSVVAGVTNTLLPNTVAGFSANVNSYTQLTIQNKNAGADATVDFIATADNGSDTVNYGDFGIINSGYDSNTPTNSLGNIVFAADTYLYAQGNTSNASQSGGNLAIGTTVPGKNVKIFVGGVNSNAIMANISNTGMTINGNVVANNFSGNISITGNITGTSPNVSLVAGSYTMTFDNTGLLSLPSMGGDEGGEINLGIPATNTSLVSSVKFDVYQNRIRFFDGSTKGVYIDLSQAATGVGTLLNNRVSGIVNAGTFVTMDLIKATVTTTGNRGLSLATTTGTITYNIGGTYGMSGGITGGQSFAGQTLTTTATTSIFGWGFAATGDLSTYVLTDTTNSRCYRITLMIGASFNNNSIVIERLI